MLRIFSIISAIAVFMVLLAGGGIYWLSSIKISDSDKMAKVASARGLANGISVQIEALQQSVDGLSRASDTVAALSSGDPAMISAEANKLQAVMPGALKVRLLPPGISEPDQTALPRMGFGDLDMVQST